MNDPIKKAREALGTADESLYARQNRLRSKEAQLINTKRAGKEGDERAARLEAEIASLKERIAGEQETVQSLKAQLASLVGEFVLPLTPQQLVSRLDDRLPCLLFPLRIETRFMGAGASKQLWVRVYPDDIAVHTHEKELTRDEADSGVQYWTERTVAASIEDASERERLEKGAWRALANSYGGTRASWVASEIKRRAMEKEGSEDFSFLLIRVQVSGILNDPQLSADDKRSSILSLLDSTHPLIALIRDKISELLANDAQLTDPTRQAITETIAAGILTHLGFDLEELKPESWSRAPRTEVMPDRFVLVGFTRGIKLEQPFPNAVPNPLILGPNPQSFASELEQRGGDLIVGEDYAWVTDFDKAVAAGMAMRLPLNEPFASAGFDRLMVLGMRVSSEAAEHKELLEELIDNHHYSPDGMSFLKQGTPTNHTGEARSGFSTDDAEGDASFETETKETGLEALTDELEKTDAQRLAEALDIELGKLASLANAEATEVSQAKVMNRALWSATLGFYLEELLEMEAATIGKIRLFFTETVVARGSLPAIRVGKQPYGILLTSAFGKWRIDEKVDGEDASFLRQTYDVLKKVEAQWQQLVGQVAHVDGGGDSFEKLLDMLGLQATSVDFQRRIGTYKDLLWNLAHLRMGVNFSASDPVARYFREISSRGIALLNQLGLGFSKMPKLFGLLFSNGTSPINGPFVDDVEKASDEKLSETAALPRKYAVAVKDVEEEETEDRNYIGWLVGTDVATLKEQKLLNRDGNALPVPMALLYRMLHRALLLSHFDATMNLYEAHRLVAGNVRREQDFTNVEAGRTVTRWEFMEAKVNRVMPQLSLANLSVGDFLATPEGLNLPAAFTLAEVRDSIGRLEELKTAELERLFAEHLDLCSYRLDAWQTALFARRLERLNLLRESSTEEGVHRHGLHLGAYGWLENVRPAPAPLVVSPDEIPESLREEGVSVIEQPDNGGYIHAPSINHAVAAAVLRNAYLTHARQEDAEHFSVKLTSERVRTALSFLEGVRNGQELGALLGYQFERALHDRYVVDGTALEQFILAFRKQYPLVADKITPDQADERIDLKEASHVVDGYALLEAVFLKEPRLEYPFGVEGLPTEATETNNRIKQAIIAEVARLEETLDAIADLSLAEGVFQVTQGNYERAGAMLKALSEGNAPPEPEIVNTPRSGAVVNHRLTVHLETENVVSPWGGRPTPKSVAAPGLNKLLGELIGRPDSLGFEVGYELDDVVTFISLLELELQPIDLIYLVGEQAGAVRGERQASDLTELEARIEHVFRLKRKAADPDWDSSGRAMIHFMSRAKFPSPDIRTLFELFPLLRNLRRLVSESRPLGADDYQLHSEGSTDPRDVENPKRWNLQALENSLKEAAASLRDGLDDLGELLASVPPSALSKDPAEAGDLSGVDYDALREALVRLSYFGLSGAFPKRALLPELPPGATDEERLMLLRAQQSLIEQATLTHEEGARRHSQAESLRTFSELSDEQVNRLKAEEKAGIFQQAGALILGDAFRLIPTFNFNNRPELEAAHAFSHTASPEQSLLRFTQDRLKSASANSVIQDWRALAVEEWLQGVAAVREKVRMVDEVQTHQEAFAGVELTLAPLQLPFDKKAHWVALEFPEVSPEESDNPNSFVPAGDFLSIVRHLPAGHSDAATQAGLLIDEWNEVIPNRVETTGIAIHYNQPNTEPPQCLLLAISPTVNGRGWQWDNLVDTLIDTFDRAKRRAVEPDFLRATPYAQLLPAVLSTFTSHPFGTISTNLAAQPSSMIFER
ncbi:MAG TPA: hypothetical protein VF553_20920 [Pyrinomonadaceae bacterium]|jgi:hypothetical protein